MIVLLQVSIHMNLPFHHEPSPLPRVLAGIGQNHEVAFLGWIITVPPDRQIRIYDKTHSLILPPPDDLRCGTKLRLTQEFKALQLS